MNIESVYGQIDEQRAILVKLLNMAKKNPISPNQLSDVCMKLAILNELLGGYIPDLKAEQLAKEQEIYLRVKREGTSDTGSQSQARMGSILERQAFEKADIRHTDLWKLISMAQSHIRAEGEERKGM